VISFAKQHNFQLRPAPDKKLLRLTQLVLWILPWKSQRKGFGAVPASYSRPKAGAASKVKYHLPKSVVRNIPLGDSAVCVKHVSISPPPS
jgi:hypothetical protein